MAEPERAEMSASEVGQAKLRLRVWQSWRSQQSYLSLAQEQADEIARYAAHLEATLAAHKKRIEALEAAMRDLLEAAKLHWNRGGSLETLNRLRDAVEVGYSRLAALQPTPTKEADDGA